MYSFDVVIPVKEVEMESRDWRLGAEVWGRGAIMTISNLDESSETFSRQAQSSHADESSSVSLGCTLGERDIASEQLLLSLDLSFLEFLRTALLSIDHCCIEHQL
jgi:hypothetical protein